MTWGHTSPLGYSPRGLSTGTNFGGASVRVPYPHPADSVPGKSTPSTHAGGQPDAPYGHFQPSPLPLDSRCHFLRTEWPVLRTPAAHRPRFTLIPSPKGTQTKAAPRHSRRYGTPDHTGTRNVARHCYRMLGMSVRLLLANLPWAPGNARRGGESAWG